MFPRRGAFCLNNPFVSCGKSWLHVSVAYLSLSWFQRALDTFLPCSIPPYRGSLFFPPGGFTMVVWHIRQISQSRESESLLGGRELSTVS